jgi:serine protease AprX
VHRRASAVALAAVIALVSSFVPGPVASASAVMVDVIVREANPATDGAERLVESLGGSVGGHLDLIGGFSAEVPAAVVDRLAADHRIEAVTPDGTVRLTNAGWDDATAVLAGVDFKTYSGSLYQITRSTKAPMAWNKGYTGEGIDVALIDTGVVPVAGLPAWKVVNGPDLSFDSQNGSYRYLDGYGHGTHMAGIIAGLDGALSGVQGGNGDNLSNFRGIAPGARIISVKVGAHDGAVDVSQMVAAIDWVVQHRKDDGLNIKVLNLSFGTDSTQSYLLDPLAFAAEQAWKKGIVVVAAAGNDGNSVTLRNPAFDPFVIAVGSADASQFDTGTNARVDYDRLSPFSNCGAGSRGVDILAPGKSITSLRAPGSYADDTYPHARVGDRFFLGSGTSQAAAVVSGAAAVLLSRDPELDPDEVKYLLKANATPLSGVSQLCQGSGLIDLGFVADKRLSSLRKVEQTFSKSTGLGSLEAARGTDHLVNNGVVLSGEKDIFGAMFDSRLWAPLAARNISWSGGVWNGTCWSGSSWSGSSWSGVSWSGASWSGTSWSGLSWSGLSWSDKYWNGLSWSGTSWSGGSWSGLSWSGRGWLGQSWG